MAKGGNQEARLFPGRDRAIAIVIGCLLGLDGYLRNTHLAVILLSVGAGAGAVYVVWDIFRARRRRHAASDSELPFPTSSLTVPGGSTIGVAVGVEDPFLDIPSRPKPKVAQPGIDDPGEHETRTKDATGGEDIERRTYEREHIAHAGVAGVTAIAYDASVTTASPEGAGVDSPGTHETLITNPDGTTNSVERRTFERTEWKYDSDSGRGTETEAVHPTVVEARSPELVVAIEREDTRVLPVGGTRLIEARFVGVKLRVRSLSGQDQWISEPEWLIHMPQRGMWDEVADGEARMVLQALQSEFKPLPDTVPAEGTVQGWYWQKFPNRSGGGRYGYQLTLHDGLGNRYQLPVAERAPGTFGPS
jgi:hypothetical protein